MTDWNKAVALPTHIGVTSRLSIGPRTRVFGTSGGGGSQTWMNANEAVYIPVRIPYSYPVHRVYWVNGSVVSTGHADFGIYTANGDRILSTGSTVLVGASAVQYVAVTPIILSPGLYYFAYANDGTTNRVSGFSMATSFARSIGCLVQLTALPLPGPATFAQAPATCVIPFCGITRTGSGF